MIRTVNGCYDCYFIEDDLGIRKRTCVITGKEIGTLEQNHPTPKWCPLRRRDVIVNLKESKE